jgi:hypothetical protein
MSILKSITSAAILFALSSAVSADVISVYSQNFDSMGTGTAAPSGWSVYSISGGHDQFTPADDTTNTGVLPTGSAIQSGTLQSTLLAQTASTSTSQKASQGYNWAVNGSSTNRSLGTSPTGVAGMVLQAVIPNNTGAAITSLNIDYDTLVQSVTTNNNNYTSNNYVGIEELPGYWLFYSLDGGATYTNIAALNGNGHTWANTIGTVHESAADVPLSGTWNPGANLYLRWFDDNAQGPSPDQKIGLDNLVISSTSAPVPEPGTLALLGVAAIVTAHCTKRRRIAE